MMSGAAFWATARATGREVRIDGSVRAAPFVARSISGCAQGRSLAEFFFLCPPAFSRVRMRLNAGLRPTDDRRWDAIERSMHLMQSPSIAPKDAVERLIHGGTASDAA
jgi:hypothetical protein